VRPEIIDNLIEKNALHRDSNARPSDLLRRALTTMLQRAVGGSSEVNDNLVQDVERKLCEEW
jgi:hypothetical protein